MEQAANRFDARYEWKAVLLLALGFGLVGMDRWIIAPLAPAIMADLNIGPQAINNLVAALGVAWGASAVAMGGLADRIGRRKVLIPAILLFSLASGLSGAAGGLLMLLVIRAGMGVAEGAFCPASFAATADAAHPSRLGFAQGFQQSMFALLGLGIAPIVATWLLDYMSWRWVFALVAVPGLLLTFLLWRVIREPASFAPRAEKVDRAAIGPVLAERNIQLSMAGLLCAMCGIFVLGANVPLYLTTSLGLTTQQMGLVTSGIGFGGFIGQWGLPALSDLFGRRVMAVIGFSAGALLLVGFMQCGPEPGLLFAWLFGSATFSFGLLSLLTGPVAAEAAPPGMVSTASGLIIGVGEIFGGGLALVVAGYVIQAYGVEYMLYVALTGLVIGAVLMLFLRETAPRIMQRRMALNV